MSDGLNYFRFCQVHEVLVEFKIVYGKYRGEPCFLYLLLGATYDYNWCKCHKLLALSINFMWKFWNYVCEGRFSRSISNFLEHPKLKSTQTSSNIQRRSEILMISFKPYFNGVLEYSFETVHAFKVL